MTWQDRQQPMSYTAPDGSVVVCECFEVTEEFELLGKIWSFPGASQQYVQRTGITSSNWPLACVFNGPDHDTQSKRFEDLLKLPGRGKLQLPLRGLRTVVPFGRVVIREDLVMSANQTIVEVSFFAQGEATPRVAPDAVGATQQAVEASNTASAASFGKRVKLDTKQRELRTQNAITTVLATVQQTFGKAFKHQGQVRGDFAKRTAAVNRALSVLIGNPIALAQSTIGLVQLPAQSVMQIEAKLAGYANAIEALLGLGMSSGTPSSIPAESENDFRVADVCLIAAVTGLAGAAVDPAQYDSRAKALEAATQIIEENNRVIVWRDERQQELDLIDDGEAGGALIHAVDLVTTFLVESSFSLPTERVTVLDRARGSLELCAELYQAVDEATYDRFIRSNKLSGAEILELPQGRRVLQYV